MKKQNPSRSFRNQHFYVGIDVHKKRWIVTVRSSRLSLKTFSMDPVLEQLKEYLISRYPDATFHLVYEIGFYGFWIYGKLKQLGLHCIVVNPADVPTAHKEKDRKSDPIDSYKLARELEKRELQSIYVPNEQTQRLRSLARLYHRTVQSSTRIKDSIKGHLHYNGIDLPKHTSQWSNNFISHLRKLNIDNGPGKECLYLMFDELDQHRSQLAIILKSLRHYVRKYERLSTLCNLMSIPGIGFKNRHNPLYRNYGHQQVQKS